LAGSREEAKFGSNRNATAQIDINACTGIEGRLFFPDPCDADDFWDVPRPTQKRLCEGITHPALDEISAAGKRQANASGSERCYAASVVVDIDKLIRPIERDECGLSIGPAVDA
jgi:hypothetical protein